MPQKTVAFYTLGCKLNFTETSAIARSFIDAGYGKVDFGALADVYVINTCSVTDNADKECRRLAGQLNKRAPGSFIIVTGCYAQLKPDEIAAIDGVDLVLGANEKFKAAKHAGLLIKQAHAQVMACEIDTCNNFEVAQSDDERTRVFMKLQDGCDYNCTFCTIPMARGRSRSDTIANAIIRVNEAILKGASEIVLTGVNLGDFGINAANGQRNESFLKLLTALDKINSPVRFRISSIEPNLLTEDLIDFVATSGKVVPHFHMPLQSGSDKILKHMRRRYLTGLYSQRVAYIKQLMPHCCIGVDVITGFPGETEDDFLETYNFLNRLPVSYLHVFTYSERENTPAAEMEDVVPYSERKKRTNMLRILSMKKMRQFCNEQQETVRPVLFEADNKNGFMHGYSDNYIKVKTRYNPVLINQLIPCLLKDVDENNEVQVAFQLNPADQVYALS